MASSMNLWGQISQQKRREMTSGFRYDPFIVAAIARKDVEGIQAISEGNHDNQKELSYQQYDVLVTRFGLEQVANPIIFAYLLAKNEFENANFDAEAQRVKTLQECLKCYENKTEIHDNFQEYIKNEKGPLADIVKEETANTSTDVADRSIAPGA